MVVETKTDLLVTLAVIWFVIVLEAFLAILKSVVADLIVALVLEEVEVIGELFLVVDLILVVKLVLVKKVLHSFVCF